MSEHIEERIKLEHRQIIDIPRGPNQVLTRTFGISLTAAEAQDFIARGYRVFGDDEGPYLMIRIDSTRGWPFVSDKNDVDVTFRPIEWAVNGRSGVICWLEHII